MSDDPEHKDPIERLGDTIEKCLPESLRTEQTATILGGLLGFLSGFILTTAAIHLLFPHDERDEQ
jgi:hypothetical protein